MTDVKLKANAYAIPYVDCPQCDEQCEVELDAQAGGWATRTTCSMCWTEFEIDYGDYR